MVAVQAQRHATFVYSKHSQYSHKARQSLKPVLPVAFSRNAWCTRFFAVENRSGVQSGEFPASASSVSWHDVPWNVSSYVAWYMIVVVGVLVNVVEGVVVVGEDDVVVVVVAAVVVSVVVTVEVIDVVDVGVVVAVAVVPERVQVCWGVPRRQGWF